MSEETPIRILVADIQPIVLDGLKSVFAAEQGMEVVGAATSGEELFQSIEQLNPDLILIDTASTHWSGLELLPQLRKRAPACRVMVFTMQTAREHITQAVRAGARGYIMKTVLPAELVAAVRTVHSGEVCFSPAASRVLLD